MSVIIQWINLFMEKINRLDVNKKSWLHRLKIIKLISLDVNKKNQRFFLL